MINTLTKLAGTAVAILSLNAIGCGNLNEVDANRRVMAKNVVLDNAVGTEVLAAEVDMTTKVLASNVMIDPSITTRSYLQSTNSQDALAELSLDLGKVIVGQWQVQNLLDPTTTDGPPPATGSIRFDADGTWEASAGRIAAAGICVECPTPSNNTPTSHKGSWQVIENFMVVMSWDNNTGTAAPQSEMKPVRSAGPQADGSLRVVFHGHGGINAAVTGQVSAFVKAAQ